MFGEGLALASSAYQIYRDRLMRKREDTAYQRAANDMRQAGINPALHNVSPAGSAPGPQDLGVNSALQQRLVSSQIALQKSQALATAVTSARELATTFKEAGVNLGGFSLGGKYHSKDNSALVNYMNEMLHSVGLKDIRFRPNPVPVASAKQEAVQDSNESETQLDRLKNKSGKTPWYKRFTPWYNDVKYD